MCYLVLYSEDVLHMQQQTQFQHNYLSTIAFSQELFRGSVDGCGPVHGSWDRQPWFVTVPCDNNIIVSLLPEVGGVDVLGIELIRTPSRSNYWYQYLQTFVRTSEFIEEMR